MGPTSRWKGLDRGCNDKAHNLESNENRPDITACKCRQVDAWHLFSIPPLSVLEHAVHRRLHLFNRSGSRENATHERVNRGELY